MAYDQAWFKKAPLWHVWNGMIQRCTNPNAHGYFNYGGASNPVRVCKLLRGYKSFVIDLGPKPAGVITSLGRWGDIDNYSCGHCDECVANGWERNVSWQTRGQQELEKQVKRWNKKLIQIHNSLAAVAA
jgi:hypothetical protein